MIFTCTEYSPRSRIFSKDFPLFIPYSSLRVYSLPRASLTRFHKLGGLNNRIHWLTVLEARSMKPRCWQGSSFWGLRETTCCMFLSQLLVLCWKRLAFFSLWPHHPNLCLHPHWAFSLCACLPVPKFPLFIDTNHIGSRSTLITSC